MAFDVRLFVLGEFSTLGQYFGEVSAHIVKCGERSLFSRQVHRAILRVDRINVYSESL
jgi:hypothetical protein